MVGGANQVEIRDYKFADDTSLYDCAAIFSGIHSLVIRMEKLLGAGVPVDKDFKDN